MKQFPFIPILIVFLAFIGCSSDDVIQNYNITGKAQKGPLLSGSVVTLSEIDKNLVQSGKVFTTNINTDDGFFEMKELTLKSPFALLTANGFYFNEVYGNLSPTQITLQAYVDLTNKDSVNVNILTHLTKQRIEKLVAEGKNLNEAKTQAEGEFLKFMGQETAIDKAFEDMDISKTGETNAILLAFSVISQRYSLWGGVEALSTAELSELLTKISTDFKDDGLMTDPMIIDTLMHNIGQINLEDVRKNVEERYGNGENPSTIPNFEKYVTLFQKNHSKVIYNNFEYPALASPFPLISTDGVIDNILHESKTGKLECKAYSIAAFVPFDKKLRINIIINSGEGFMRGAPDTGWKTSFTREPLVYTYESQRCNMLLSTLVNLQGTGSATIEFYEDNLTTPSKIHNVSW
jgi:hypothetical protein